MRRSSGSRPPSQPVRVVNVVDGDTVDVVPARARRGGNVTRVRLWGIDAPEWDQPLGREATLALGNLLRDGPGVLRMEVFAYDQYARALGLLYWERDGRGRSVNRVMVGLGMAYTSRHRQGAWFRKELGFYSEEADARRRNEGIWALPNSLRVTPWAHRSRVRRPAEVGSPIRFVLVLLAFAMLASVLLSTGLCERLAN
ncbi:MAG: thermonuclease family protein [Chloroflexota bacterium]|nr:thermonuclease family protein [Chloroflexota bacterium]